MENFNLMVSGININVPYTLRSLPDGTSDKLIIDRESQTAYTQQNIGYKKISGLYGVVEGVYVNRFRFLKTNIGMLYGYVSNAKFFCNTFRPLISTWDRIESEYPFSGNMSTGAFEVVMPKSFTTQEQMLAWLDANPTYLQFPLSKPTTEPMPYQDIATNQGTTEILTDSLLNPNITASVKILDI